jgi:hypothetical protein
LKNLSVNKGMMRLFPLYIVVLLALYSCKREQAVWESDWQLPIVQDSLSLAQLVEDSLITVNGSNYELSIDRTIFELKLSDFVKLPDTTVKHAYAIPLNNFNVQPGTSFVNNVQEHVIDMGSVELKKIRIKAGGIQIRVESPIETTTFFTVELPGATKNGITLTQSFSAPAGTNSLPGFVEGYVDLTGYEIDLRGASYGSFNRIQTKMQVKTDPLGPVVTVNTQDSMRFNFTMNGIQLDYARGYFGSISYADTLRQNIPALSSIQSGLLDLDAATIGLTIENGFKVNSKLKLTTLKNTNAEGTEVSLVHPSIGTYLTINAATGTEQNLVPSETQLMIDGSNSTIEPFLENHGAVNDIGFELQLNPWGNVSGGWDEIFDAHPLKVNFTGNLPLAIGMTDLIIQDTFDFPIHQDPLKTHVKSGIIWLKATNAFPFQGKITLYLLDNSGNEIGVIQSDNEVASSVYGSVVNGVMQKQSYVQFEVPSTILDYLGNVATCVVKLKLNTPDASTNSSTQQSIPEGAFFGFKLGAKLVIENRL